MNPLKLCIIFSINLIIIAGCSVYMAANQADKKNVHVLDKGTPRSHVMAELGKPLYTKNETGKTCDVFSFVQGYGKGEKAGRAIFHGAADFLTLGLWEVVGTPVEAIADGISVQVEVYYDENECVESVKVFKGIDELKTVTSINSSGHIKSTAVQQPTTSIDMSNEKKMEDRSFETEVPNEILKLAVFPFYVNTANANYIGSVEDTAVYALGKVLSENKVYVITHSYYDIGNSPTVRSIDYSIVPSGNTEDLWLKTTYSKKTPNALLLSEIGKNLNIDYIFIESITAAGTYEVYVEQYLIDVKTKNILKKQETINYISFNKEIYGFTKMCFDSFQCDK